MAEYIYGNNLHDCQHDVIVILVARSHVKCSVSICSYALLKLHKLLLRLSVGQYAIAIMDLDL